MPYCPQCQRDFKVLPACPQCGLPLIPRATAGFAVALIGGIIILLGSLALLIVPFLWALYSAIVGPFLPILVAYGLITVSVGLIAGVFVIIGAAVIYIPRKEYAGAAIVLVFSILSIIVFGGFIVGITMGIVGAGLGFGKK